MFILCHLSLCEQGLLYPKYITKVCDFKLALSSVISFPPTNRLFTSMEDIKNPLRNLLILVASFLVIGQLTLTSPLEENPSLCCTFNIGSVMEPQENLGIANTTPENVKSSGAYRLSAKIEDFPGYPDISVKILKFPSCSTPFRT